MIHPRLLPLFLMAVILLCPIHAPAQQKNDSEKTEKTNAALREKAFKVLESLAGELSTLQSAENRARIGSNLAGSLWDHDEQRARAILALVQGEISTQLQVIAIDDREYAETLAVFLKLRLDTIERILKHDGEAAFAFLKATELSSDKPLPYGVAENLRSVELQFAEQIAARNPAMALQLGRKSLDKGFSHELLGLLRQLNRKHKEQARILHKEIVNKLKDVDLVGDWSHRFFAHTLVNTFMPPNASDSTYRELIEIFVKRAMDQGCGGKIADEDGRTEFCHWVGSAVPQIAKFDSRGARLKRWVTAEEETDADTPAAIDQELNDLTSFGTVDEILALVPKYPEMESQIYWRALNKARMSGDMERARKLAADYKGNPETREAMLAEYPPKKTSSAVDTEKLVNIQDTLNTLPSTRKRIEFLVNSAESVGVADRNAALKLLNQAAEMTDTMSTGSEKTLTQMGLALLHCSEKSDKGLAMMEPLVPLLNDLVSAAAKLDGYDTAYLRDGEWNMSGQGELGGILTTLSQNAAYFAWCDFDRALSLSAQFERSEIRMMAQLKLAQGILVGPPKRLR